MLLTHNRIIAAAMDLIEAEGPQAISMTRLATELGCGLIPLYSHVPSTSALLDGIAAVLMSRRGAAPPAGQGWADQVRAQARAARQAGRTYPVCSVVVAGRAPTTAALHRPTEHALATLRTAGFCGEDAVRIVRAVAAYLTGMLVHEVGSSPGSSPGLGARFAGDAWCHPRLRAAEFPQITSLGAELAQADPDADFEAGLELLVLGMDALLARRARG